MGNKLWFDFLNIGQIALDLRQYYQELMKLEEIEKAGKQ